MFSTINWCSMHRFRNSVLFSITPSPLVDMFVLFLSNICIPICSLSVPLHFFVSLHSCLPLV